MMFSGRTKGNIGKKKVNVLHIYKFINEDTIATSFLFVIDNVEHIYGISV